MISTKEFIDTLIREFGVQEFCGVSDSTLKYFINEVTSREIYYPFTNEGDAVAYAAGRTLSGAKTVVLMQNSGLTNASSPISSLTSLYGIPMTYIVGWRGCSSDGTPDEPQHKIIGRNTVDLIKAITDNYQILHFDNEDHFEVVAENIVNRKTLQTFILVERKVKMTSVDAPKLDSKYVLNRMECIKLVKKIAEECGASVVSTTGFTSRELMSLGEDDMSNFYMLGSMGCIVPFTYGVARSHPDRKFIILDGDGSFLMRPEATYICHKNFRLDNVLHIIFNNLTHLSTGGQSIPSEDLSSLLSAIIPGSRTTRACEDLSALEFFVNRWIKGLSPLTSTILVDTSNEVCPNLPRPKKTPEEILETFKLGLC